VKTRFGPFTIDSDTRQLIGRGREVHLAPKAFELLAILVAERPSALSKAVLQERLWPGTFVVEANLSNLIAEIRDALGDRPRPPRFIRTVHRFGYAFCGHATSVAAPRSDDSEHVLCWLEWGRQRFGLSMGEHVIGRDPDVEIPLDGSTVSRRHARLLVGPDCTTLKDFGSKNGTFRGDQRVTASTLLEDGDALRFGSLLLTFHVRDRSITTKTQVRPIA